MWWRRVSMYSLSITVDPEVFSAEFRHTTVMNFISGLFDGTIKIGETKTKRETAAVTKTAAEIVRGIEKYVSGNLESEENLKLKQTYL
jgi:hypothetical protein